MLDSETLLKRYKGILRIQINHSNAGFFAYVTFVLNQLRYCEEKNYFPVVYFGPHSGDGPNAFFDERYGENTWDYYFEPVAGITDKEIRNRTKDANDPLSEEHIIELTSDAMWNLHAYDPESIYNYPYGYYKERAFRDINGWYTGQRRKARYYLAKYVQPKKHITEKVGRFWKSDLEGAEVLGIHMRGSDKGSADSSPELMRIVQPEEYFF